MTRTLFSDSFGRYYLRVSIRGYSYLIKRRGIRRRYRVHVPGYSYLLRVRQSEPVRVKPTRVKPSRVPRRALRRVPKRAPKRVPKRVFEPKRVQEWRPAKDVYRAAVKKYAVDLSRSDSFTSIWKWFHSHHKLLTRFRRYPPDPKAIRYVVLRMWFVVWDPEDERHYIWVQSISLSHKLTLGEIVRHLPKGADWEHMTVEEMKLRLPVSLRVQTGVPFERVRRDLARHVRERIEVLEEETSPTAQSPGADRQVKAFLAWAPYPSVDSYQKVYKRRKK